MCKKTRCSSESVGNTLSNYKDVIGQEIFQALRVMGQELIS